MKKFITVAVIAALALATQAFAIGGGTKAGQTMSSTMTKTTMNTGSKMTAGTPAIAFAAPMNGTGSMNTTMSSTGTTKTKMTPVSPKQPATTK